MLRADKFWDDECQQPLLKMDKGFIHEQGVEKLIERASKWKTLANLTKEDIVDVDFGTDEPERIFVLDAERTFHNDDNKKKLVRILTYLNKQFGDYQQGVSFITSFLLLTLEENEAVAILLRINKMLPGFWRHEAISFGTEAFAFFHILEEVYPKVADHLKANLIDAATFCQRWFLGLCVHCLPFRELFRFVEQFLEGGGRPFLIRFGLALFGELQNEILETNDYNTIFALLRLDGEVIKDQAVFGRILDTTTNYETQLAKYDMDIVRAEVYEKYLKKRIESAHQVHAAAEVIDDCQWCLDNLPEAYCVDCRVVVCQDCLDAEPQDKGHDFTKHTVISMEEYEDNREKYIKPKDQSIESKLSEMKI